ncbi:YcgN family cysteine cluster protein [Pelagerythrobacter aerophilus]|uniref:YcgN family cysteine cluster protein n=1 Tax=Pelagerythrobacter aerophilus TaxID=2306995 RepID=A0A418NH65_9SPHN|nr:YcgN family cysteine cluster protein [Pelagerythrobacter aerophilus]RIV77939.1 YcgN family cysteine cluster protein [Pelagerythrobacter aerophilus]
MGALRDRFWERPLAELSREEWEALCDGCGRCCLHKIEDADTGEIEDTNVACKLLDTGTARCRDYRNRKAFVPDCLRLTLKIVGTVSWLPETCAYRRRAADEPLPEWHPLLTGDPDSVKRAGASVAGRVVSETDAGPLEHHIVDWSDV